MEAIVINPFEWVSTQFLLRARMHDDEAAIILKGHLLVEYLLDRIIEVKISSKRNLLKSRFSQKLDKLYHEGLLSEPLKENIHRLNRFRNKLAHQLDFSINRDDMKYTKGSGDVIIVKPKRGRYPQRYYYRLLCHVIISDLTRYMMVNLKIDPRWHKGF